MSKTVSETPLSGDIARYARHQLRGVRGLIVAGIAMGGAALWFGWPWLVAVGVAPLLIAFAPCALMCGLGLCAMKGGAKANLGEGGSNISDSDANCCAQPQAEEAAPPREMIDQRKEKVQ